MLVDAEELLSGDDMLLAYAEAMDGSAAATLAIDASRLPPDAAAQQLHGLVERCRLNDRSDVDLLAVIGPCDAAQRHRMLDGAHARYRRTADEHGPLPVFTPDSIGGLPALTA